jgi:hypothetical protein
VIRESHRRRPVAHPRVRPSVPYAVTPYYTEITP